MPVRKYHKIRRFDSEEVQGEGSWVDLHSMTWGDVTKVMDGGSLKELDDAEVGIELIANMVVDWNWVDDDGEPLPQPTPDLIKSLPVEELMFLGNLIDLKEFTQKKSLKPSSST